MTVQNAKALAHELTMEYIKKSSILCDSAISNIPKMVETVADVNKSFYDAIKNNETLSELYQ